MKKEREEVENVMKIVSSQLSVSSQNSEQLRPPQRTSAGQAEGCCSRLATRLLERSSRYWLKAFRAGLNFGM